MTVPVESRATPANRMYHHGMPGRRTSTRVCLQVLWGPWPLATRWAACCLGTTRQASSWIAEACRAGGTPATALVPQARLRIPEAVLLSPPPESGLDSRLRGNDFVLCLGHHQTDLPVTASSCQPSSSRKSPASLFPRRLKRIVPVESITVQVGNPSVRYDLYRPSSPCTTGKS